MSTLAEFADRNPFLQPIIPFWESCGVTGDDLPDPLPVIDMEWFLDPAGNDVWLAENLPKVAAKVEAKAVALGIRPPKESNA